MFPPFLCLPDRGYFSIATAIQGVHEFRAGFLFSRRNGEYVLYEKSEPSQFHETYVGSSTKNVNAMHNEFMYVQDRTEISVSNYAIIRKILTHT